MRAGRWTEIAGTRGSQGARKIDDGQRVRVNGEGGRKAEQRTETEREGRGRGRGRVEKGRESRSERI